MVSLWNYHPNSYTSVAISHLLEAMLIFIWVKYEVVQVVEYTDCIYGSTNSGALGNAEYPFIAIVSRSVLTWSGSIW